MDHANHAIQAITNSVPNASNVHQHAPPAPPRTPAKHVQLVIIYIKTHAHLVVHAIWYPMAHYAVPVLHSAVSAT